MITISEILKGSEYSLTQFSKEKILQLEERIEEKEVKGKPTPYINCIVRNKAIKLTPEEVVRQLYLMVLTEDYHYPVSRMELEYVVTFGREKKRADIVIFDKDQTYTPYIIVELKSPKLKDGKEQLKSYCNGTGAPIGVWTNGESISYYHRKDPNFFEDIPIIPKANEKLSDILSERWFIDDLVKKDKLVNERKSLKDLILEMEDEVLANAGVDVFEEVFKLIFTKLYDEMESGRKKDRHLEFRNYGDTDTELKEKLQNLFNEAKEKWSGVFTEDAKLMLTPSHLSVCVSSLQDVKLFNSNLDVVDEAFEYLINKSSKGEKGQYFTPRYVIDMCVRMLNPSATETMIDTTAGDLAQTRYYKYSDGWYEAGNDTYTHTTTAADQCAGFNFAQQALYNNTQHHYALTTVTSHSGSTLQQQDTYHYTAFAPTSIKLADSTTPHIYAHDGRIFATEPIRIYTLTGLDVTSLNGSLKGIYIIKTATNASKIIVR